jgi:hypothetical protein
MTTYLNPLDAAYHVAHDYPGGIAALSVRMDTSPNVLNKKVDPNSVAHHLRLDEALKISAITNDHRILQSFASQLGYITIQLPEVIDGGDMAMLDGFMAVINELGEFTAAFQTAYSDGSITQKELEQIKAQALDVQTRLAQFVQRIESIAV